MTTEQEAPIRATRRVGAPAHEIFELLATPSRHIEFDGSGMLRGSEHQGQLRGVGDEFLMRMYYEQFGDYVMRNVVVEYEPDRRIGWAPVRHDIDDDEDWQHRWVFELEPDGPAATTVTETYDLSRSPDHAKTIMKNGSVWLKGMQRSLERIDAIFSGDGAQT
jgi:uncharacterized protein YndB with AHSA1/START domain